MNPANTLSENNQKVADELIRYMKQIQDFDKDMAQDGSSLHAYLIELTNIMARCNLLMAEYKRFVRLRKLEAYKEFSNTGLAPSILKDVVDVYSSGPAYIYDLSERCSRLCTHVIDALRTIISSLKSERMFAPNQQ